MQGKQVTIFGGTGFLGRYIIQELAKAGARIKVATREVAKANFLKPLGEVGQITPLSVNYHDPHSLKAAIAHSQIVINCLGALVETKKGLFPFLHTDLPGQLAKIATKNKLQDFIHISAIGADTKSPARYAQTKARGEGDVLKAFPDAIIIRPSIIFGPEDKFFNLFAQLACFSPALALPGGGTTRFQPVYVKDIAIAIAQALDHATYTKSPHAGHIYELGGPTIYTFKEILQFILRVINRKRLLMPVPFGMMHYIASIIQYLPHPLITPDQNLLLQQDNIVHTGAKTFEDFSITPHRIEDIVPTYLERFRPHN